MGDGRKLFGLLSHEVGLCFSICEEWKLTSFWGNSTMSLNRPWKQISGLHLEKGPNIPHHTGNNYMLFFFFFFKTSYCGKFKTYESTGNSTLNSLVLITQGQSCFIFTYTSDSRCFKKIPNNHITSPINISVGIFQSWKLMLTLTVIFIVLNVIMIINVIKYPVSIQIFQIIHTQAWAQHAYVHAVFLFF